MSTRVFGGRVEVPYCHQVMSEQDRRDWDDRYSEDGVAHENQPGPPPTLAAVAHLFPVEGRALDIACGPGRAAVWLALRGMEVLGVDVSSVAIDLARRLASLHGVSNRCRFEVHDLDSGLPEGPPVDLLLCHRFRDPRLDEAMINRLEPGGLLAVAALSEVGATPGRFRTRPGELNRAFRELEVAARGEADGVAWLVGRKPG